MRLVLDERSFVVDAAAAFLAYSSGLRMKAPLAGATTLARRQPYRPNCHWTPKRERGGGALSFAGRVVMEADYEGRDL